MRNKYHYHSVIESYSSVSTKDSKGDYNHNKPY